MISFNVFSSFMNMKEETIHVSSQLASGGKPRVFRRYKVFGFWKDENQTHEPPLDFHPEGPGLTWAALGSTKQRTWSTGTGVTSGGSGEDLEGDQFKLCLQRVISKCHHSLSWQAQGRQVERRDYLAPISANVFRNFLPKGPGLPLASPEVAGPRKWKTKTSTETLLGAQSKYLIISNNLKVKM